MIVDVFCFMFCGWYGFVDLQKKSVLKKVSLLQKDSTSKKAPIRSEKRSHIFSRKEALMLPKETTNSMKNRI